MTRRPTFDDVVATMARLRGPGGCPWDREQTHRSLRPYLLEEAYETLEAIDTGSSQHLCQELGDLLLQVVFHAQMSAETGGFTIDDVIAGLVEKLVRRHPHVFGRTQVEGSAEVVTNWEAIKAEERTQGLHGPDAGEPGGTSENVFDGLPRALSALALAQRLQERAAKAGFNWPDLASAVRKVREELAELEAAARSEDPAHLAEEIGDVMFTMANLPLHLHVDGEQALRDACAKFRARFARLEAEARTRGRPLHAYTPDELLDLWRAAR